MQSPTCNPHVSISTMTVADRDERPTIGKTCARVLRQSSLVIMLIIVAGAPALAKATNGGSTLRASPTNSAKNEPTDTLLSSVDRSPCGTKRSSIHNVWAKPCQLPAKVLAQSIRPWTELAQ